MMIVSKIMTLNQDLLSTRPWQVLHQDLKLYNGEWSLLWFASNCLILQLVFLDENNVIKLGDFGLSKQLMQASFANTYVRVSDHFDLKVYSQI